MRELKFRVYDPKMGKFNYFDLLSIDGNLPVDCIDNVNQYIGRSDDNGAEIYEGDLLKLSNNPKHSVTAQVSRANNGEYIAWNIDCCWYTLLAYNSKEVVGNIYENPELIKTRIY